MKILLGLITIAASLLYSIVLWKMPDVMLSPGSLSNAHAGLEHDCFSCHRPFYGTPDTRCTHCHHVVKIGIETVAGVPKADSGRALVFHKALLDISCIRCHSEHSGSNAPRPTFNHRILVDSLRQTCARCHQPPDNDRHVLYDVRCHTCHNDLSWKSTHFDHQSLRMDLAGQCKRCHAKPSNSLHSLVPDQCASCHQKTTWKPARFDHDRYFGLDDDHRVSCETCHKDGIFDVYTCYGCHEHTPENIRREHMKEGIRAFDQCVKCHRDATGEPEGRDELKLEQEDD